MAIRFKAVRDFFAGFDYRRYPWEVYCETCQKVEGKYTSKEAAESAAVDHSLFYSNHRHTANARRRERK